MSVAKTLLAGEQPTDLEQDKNARLLLSESETYVKSHLSSAALRSSTISKPILSKKAKDEIEQLLLAL
jgi:hypothetical protein